MQRIPRRVPAWSIKRRSKVDYLAELYPLVGLVFMAPRAALAADYYVATTGNDSNPGSMAQPFATL